MRTDHGYRVNIGRTVLDLAALGRVRIVAAPGLRRIVEHTGIKAGTTARAGLEQNVRELTGKSAVQVVKTKCVPMHHLTLAICRQRKAERGGHVAVHIPFDIRNLGLGENLRNHIMDIVDHFRS